MMQRQARWNDAYERLGWAMAVAVVAGILAIWLAGIAVHGTGPAPAAAASGGDLLRADAERPVGYALIRFSAAEGGGLAARTANGRDIGTLESARDGFVISMVRGLDRSRRAGGIDIREPYRLTQWNNGQVLLEDPMTGAQIELSAFGKTNVGAFRRLLERAR